MSVMSAPKASGVARKATVASNAAAKRSSPGTASILEALTDSETEVRPQASLGIVKSDRTDSYLRDVEAYPDAGVGMPLEVTEVGDQVPLRVEGRRRSADPDRAVVDERRDGDVPVTRNRDPQFGLKEPRIGPVVDRVVPAQLLVGKRIEPVRRDCAGRGPYLSVHGERRGLQDREVFGDVDGRERVLEIRAHERAADLVAQRAEHPPSRVEDVVARVGREPEDETPEIERQRRVDVGDRGSLDAQRDRSADV